MTATVDLRQLWNDINLNKVEPPTDESLWLADPKYAFIYAKYIRGTRWSDEQEVLFYNDLKVLYNYTYWIVNILGQSCPEHINNIFLARSIEGGDGSEKAWIDLYFNNIVKKNSI